MIKVENIDVWGFEHAVRGMRNPMNSWDKSDSYMCDDKHCGGKCCTEQYKDEKDCNQPDGYHIGKNDLDLMQRLYQAGSEHRKYLRQIFVSMDITAPLYWWKEMDQYRINVTTNSCSTMHTIHKKEFDWNDFSHEHLLLEGLVALKDIIDELNKWRNIYLNGGITAIDIFNPKDKRAWWQMIQLLPSSYNQKRTITMNYENVITIIKQRSGHKLDEWNDLVKIFKTLPYINEITEKKENK